MSKLKSLSIFVTDNAWKKMSEIVNKQKGHGFLFSANSGGCNGFNYDLKLIEDENHINHINKIRNISKSIC